MAGEGPPGYALELSSFAATRAYAVGTQTITLVGVVRNVGKAALPADTVTLRMYAVTGLDYLEGATAIRLPVMETGSSGTYRWKVQPTEADAPLVAALVLERNDCMPQILLLPIQHFPDAPAAFGTPGPPKPVPAAQASSSSGWIENGKVRVRVVPTSSEMAAAFLWCKAAGGWRQVGVGMPLIEVQSGEPAQDPWWEAFKINRCSAAVTPQQATLSIAGQIGVRWRATVNFTVNAASSAVDVRLTLAPRRVMQLYGIRTTHLRAGEGSFGAAATETLDPTPVGSGLSRAMRWGEITVGMIWPGRAPYEGWTSSLMTTPEGAEYRVLGAEYRGAKPVEMHPGSSVTLHWRLYAIAPSKSVRDALRVALPK